MKKTLLFSLLSLLISFCSYSQIKLHCYTFSDNFEKYVGKTVSVTFQYSNLTSLRVFDSESEGKSETDTYWRYVFCSGEETKFTLNIPYRISKNIPNITSGFIKVTGIVMDPKKIHNGINVKSIL